jgi:hypothetical protein
MVARSNKSIFLREQVIKLRNLGKSYSYIVSTINHVNGEKHQITETVKFNERFINI